MGVYVRSKLIIKFELFKWLSFISVFIPPVTNVFLCVNRGTEEVFQALEDNQVTLSVMKASRFVKAFEKEVDHWERCLSLVLEVIEMILTVQRQWMYLEVNTQTHTPYIIYMVCKGTHTSFSFTQYIIHPKRLSFSLKGLGYIIQAYCISTHTHILKNSLNTSDHPGIFFNKHIIPHIWSERSEV